MNDWKQSLKGNRGTCSVEIRDYLDLHIPSWRDVVRTNKTPSTCTVSSESDLDDKSDVISNDIVAVDVAPAIATSTLMVSSDIVIDTSESGSSVSTVVVPDLTTKVEVENIPQVYPLDSEASTITAVTSNTSAQQDSHSSMQKAQDIVNRYISRGNVLPRELRDHQHDPVREQEYRDAQKLNKWKQALSGKIGHACSDELREFLDAKMPSWRQELRKNYSDPMQKAKDIVERYKSRGCILPRQFRSGNDPLRQQENKDARKLYDWKQALKGLRFYKCSDELRDYLDTEMSGWRQNLKEVHTNPMQKAIDIVERYRMNGSLLPRQYKNGTDPKRIQENKDAQKLYNWKEALNGKRGKCSDSIREYLDTEMPGWRATSSVRFTTDSFHDDSSKRADVILSTCSDSGDLLLEDGVKRKIAELSEVNVADKCSNSQADEEQMRISKQIKKDSELLLQLQDLNSASYSV